MFCGPQIVFLLLRLTMFSKVGALIHVVLTGNTMYLPPPPQFSIVHFFSEPSLPPTAYVLYTRKVNTLVIELKYKNKYVESLCAEE